VKNTIQTVHSEGDTFEQGTGWKVVDLVFPTSQKSDLWIKQDDIESVDLMLVKS
jgi:hypothetical protein